MMVAERTALLRALGLVRRHARTAASTPPGAGPGGLSLMLGCFERGLYPRVSHTVRRLLPGTSRCRREQGCCGALHAHNGQSERGRELARRLGEELPGVIVTTAGGCAAHLAGVLGRDRVHELCEHLARTGVAPTGELRVRGRRARVAIQDSCHLRNGLRVFAEPRALIAAVADFVPVPKDDSCCGSAGTYSLLRPKDSRRILDPKLDALEAADVDYVVAVNPGCLRQLHTGLRRRGSADPGRAPGRPARRGRRRPPAADRPAVAGAAMAAGAAGPVAPPVRTAGKGAGSRPHDRRLVGLTPR